MLLETIPNFWVLWRAWSVQFRVSWWHWPVQILSFLNSLTFSNVEFLESWSVQIWDFWRALSVQIWDFWRSLLVLKFLYQVEFVESTKRLIFLTGSTFPPLVTACRIYKHTYKSEHFENHDKTRKIWRRKYKYWVHLRQVAYNVNSDEYLKSRCFTDIAGTEREGPATGSKTANIVYGRLPKRSTSLAKGFRKRDKAFFNGTRTNFSMPFEY